MNTSKAKLILHPVRMKIIQLLVNRKRMAVHQLAELMPDVPQATLYRQLNTLLKADVIEVVEENPIRGTIEKVYALKEQSIESQKDLLHMTKEEHLQLFLTFQAYLIGQYEDYLEQDNVDLVKDGVSYRVASLHLTDEEFMDLIKNMGMLIQKALANEPNPDRKVRNLATIIIPEKMNKRL